MTSYYNEIDPYAAQWLRNLIDAGHIAPGDVDERSVADVRADDVKGYTQPCRYDRKADQLRYVSKACIGEGKTHVKKAPRGKANTAQRQGQPKERRKIAQDPS